MFSPLQRSRMVKRQDKYTWHIGSPPPPIDPHSLVKHQIVRKYLERYIQVLMSNYRIEKLTLSIVDGFAGGGEYLGERGEAAFHDGSPLLALGTVAEQEAWLNVGRTKQRRVDGRFYFVEKVQSNFDYLKHLLGARGVAGRLGNDVHLFNSPFDRVVQPIIDDIRRRAGGERAIFLLDQYAYDQVPGQLLRQIFSQVKGAEVLLTFNVDSLISFLTDSTPNRRKLADMGLDAYVDWGSIERLKVTSPTQWKSVIQRSLARGLVETSGATHYTIFYITPMGNTAWTYWLVHLSRSFKARDVMMELHWEHANHFSHYLEPDIFTLGYRANDDLQARMQEAFDLGQAHHFDAVASKRCLSGLSEKLIPAVYDGEARTFDGWLEAIGSKTPATADMVREALDPGIRAGDIVARSAKGAIRQKGQSVQATDVLSGAAQRRLILLPGHLKGAS
ncbi:three-Cys-motif partner protein TcmP [Ideonella sp. DXS29W]|uniref:Three-Cys-motif partner protein TcmP n=1 Tax=Ideonella lacteola TaxID=2984193 RepID=A0ABU9BZG0_9BURK